MIRTGKICGNTGGDIVAKGRINVSPDVVFCDADPDGISDIVEAGAPNNGDGNNDGILDSQQDNVASLQNLSGQFATLASPSGTKLSGVHATGNPSPTNAPPSVRFRLGFYGFKTGLASGGSTARLASAASVTVTLFLPPGTPVNTYWRYGPTPDNTAPHWYEFLFDGTTGAEIKGNVITLHFVDGQRGDDDLTANGIFVDLGAPGFFTVLGDANLDGAVAEVDPVL